jgi:DNA invertase Pin-like site-specific DNA recombinase
MTDENLNQYSQDPVTRKIERVAAYVRVSTQEQKLHGISVDAQKAKLTEYAENHNMRIVEWYIDEGVSGRKLIRKRPELQRMIQDAEKGKFDRIIFIKLDRFFRSVAEYHECMKRITPVLWSTTEEKYDLTTASGRFFVNAKLAVAEMEADQTGERISIVNDYKLSTGQPLTGSQPFGWMIAMDPETGRKKIVKDPDTQEALEEIIQHFLTHQSKHKTTVFANVKHHTGLNYRSLSTLLRNTYLYGAYRDNPNYCEAYITKETFDKIQDILNRNVKHNTEHRAYLFTGLVICPHCGRLLKGATFTGTKNKDGEFKRYKKYRCSHYRLDHKCDFKKCVSENVIERMMLKNIEKYLEDAKVRSLQVEDADTVKIPNYDIEDIHEQIDRLNYSWQTGKIRKVEQYEAQYAELMEKLNQAEAEQGKIVVKDFTKIEAILHDGWKSIYEHLDDEHKRSFWRSFVRSIEIEWTTGHKEITRVEFF